MRVLEILVKPEEQRIRLIVDMESPDCFLTSQVPHVPRRLFQLLPRLARHTCHNGRRKSFFNECRSTEIPHLFEHLIIELQLMVRANSDDHLRGETEWNWLVDPHGRFRVTVDYCDEILAIASIRLAERILAAIDRREMDIDIDAEIDRLRMIYQGSQELVEGKSTEWSTPAHRAWNAHDLHHSNPNGTTMAPLHAEPKTR